MRGPRGELRRLRWSRALRRFLPCCVLVVAVALLGSACAPPDGGVPPSGPVQSSFWDALAYSILSPATMPQGVNDWTCTPSKSYPYPVVLVSGTIENAYANWSRLAPRLADAGYCVFVENFGEAGSPFQQLQSMRTAAAELSSLVDRVLSATGASRVSLIGHSQGGLTALYYVSVLGGASKVHRVVGVDPANRGARLWGLLTLVAALPGGSDVLAVPCQACVDFTPGSTFLAELHAAGVTRPRVQYSTIATRTSVLIEVAETRLPSASNVRNLLVQDICPRSTVNHVEMVFDDAALQIAQNELNPSRAQPVIC